MNSPARANRFMLFFILYTIAVPFIAIIALFFEGYTNQSELTQALLTTQHIILFLIPFILYIFITKERVRDILPLHLLSFKNIVLIILMSILIQSYAGVISSVTNLFINNDVGESIGIYLSEFSFPLMFWSVAILPAVLEEIVFRGIILTNYKALSMGRAAFFSALLFGIMHLNLFQFFYTFAIGIFLAILVYYTNSIFSSMLSHLVINGSQLIVAKLILTVYPIEETIEQTVITYQDKLYSLMSSILIAILVTPVFIGLFLYFIRINRHNKIDYKYNMSADNIWVSLLNPPKLYTKQLTPAFLGVIIIYALYIIGPYLYKLILS